MKKMPSRIIDQAYARYLLYYECLYDVKIVLPNIDAHKLSFCYNYAVHLGFSATVYDI